MNRIRLAVLTSVIAGVLPTSARAQFCMEFEQASMEVMGTSTCGLYVDPRLPGPLDAYDIQVAVPREMADQMLVDQMRVYYTLDDSSPSGHLGAADPGTHVAVGEHACLLSMEGTYDVFKASIPAAEKGTLVTFILSAWKQSSEPTEYFLGMGEMRCGCNETACAQPFTYVVGDGEPRAMPDEYLVAEDTPRIIQASGFLANDRYLDLPDFDNTVPVEVDSNINGDFFWRPDGSFEYAPAPGFVGTETFSYRLQCNHREYASNPATVRLVVKTPPALVSTADLAPGQGGCAAGGSRIDSGLDNGAGGGLPLDGTLQQGEITNTSSVCNGAPGGAGAAGPAARVSVSAEPAGANCAKGGQKIESGLDANGNGALDPAEVTATSYACDGAQGKSGCSAAPGALSLAGALATLAWAGAARRRRDRSAS